MIFSRTGGDGMNVIEYPKTSKRLRKQKRNTILSTIYAAIIYSFIYIPVITLIVFSFNDQEANTEWKGFTLNYYTKLFHDAELMEIFGLTLFIAVTVTALAAVIGTLGAVGLSKFEFKGKKAIDSALYIPIIIPEVVLAVAMLCTMSLVDFPTGTLAIIIGHTTMTLPYMVINVRSRMSGFDKSIEEASMDLGANRFVTFIRVTLPMIMPGVLSGAFLAFTLSLDDFIISNFVAGPGSVTLPVKVYSMLKIGIRPEINALSTLIITAFIIGYIVVNAVNKLKKVK